MLRYLMPIVLCVSFATAQNYTVQLPDSIYDQSSPVVWVKQLAEYTEGALWEPATGYVYFTDQIGGANWPIWRIKPGTTDTGSVFVSTRQSNGEELDPQGRLVACQDGRLARFTGTGDLDSVPVQSGQNGVTFNQANDLSIGPNGGIYFTDEASLVYYLSPERVLSSAASGMSAANGIEWMSEDSAVYVNETSGNRVRKFTVQSDGSLANPTVFTNLSAPDGGTIDAHGNHYIASYGLGEIHVYNANGDSLGIIRLNFATGAYDTRRGAQGNTDNCIFGGPGYSTLYITGDGGLYSIQLKIPGRTLPSSASAVEPISINPLAARQNLFVDALGRILRPEFYSRQLPALRWMR